jgi:hypothetical protein
MTEVENLAYLLRFDTVYGRYSKPVVAAGGDLAVDGRSLWTLRNRRRPAVSPVAAAARASVPATREASAGLEQRLQKLKELRDKGLINEEAYNAKVKALRTLVEFRCERDLGRDEGSR